MKFGISKDGEAFTSGPMTLTEAEETAGSDGDIIWKLSQEANLPMYQWNGNGWEKYGTSKVDLMSLWNHDTKPRKSQVDVLDWLSEQTAKFCIVEAPTGVGKSLICTTVCNDGGGVVLTPQISLQEQYLRDFPYMDLIMSSENYKCRKSTADKGSDGFLSCKRGSVLCKRDKCLGSCPYQIAKANFCSSTHGTSNYAYFWRFLGTPELILDQQWIILDEAHNLEQSLIDSASVEISEKWCKDNGFNYQRPRSFYEAIDFFVSLVEDVNRKCSELRVGCDLFEKNGDSSSLLKQLEEMLRLEEFTTASNHAYTIITSPVEDSGVKLYQSDDFDEDALIDAGLVLIRNEDRDRDGFVFKPLYASHVWETLPDFIKEKRFLLTSATILDVNQFIKNIGWPKKDVAFYRIDSPFDRDNRKVYLKGKVGLNRGNIEYEFPGVVSEADKFLRKFEGMRGIVHSHTFKLANEFFNLSKMKDRLLLHKQGEDRNALIERFMNSDQDDLVLISPSMTEGLDLKGDLARFALFLKVPYPSMGDQWVKARMDRDRSWYSWQVAKTIIQGCGRVVRSKNDWGYSVMLDGGFKSFFDREQNLFPEWFLDSVRL